ncbi:MAG: IclR family transcriptional regulator, partial [Actinomycetota bacterium]
VASVSAPVIRGETIVGAVSISGPIERLSRHPGRRFGDAVRRAAESPATPTPPRPSEQTAAGTISR